MTTKKDKKHTSLFQRFRPGRQERATELNNDGATQIVLNRRVNSLTDKTYIKTKALVDNDN